MQNIERFFEKFYELFPGSFPLLSQAVRFVMETPHREIMNLAMGNFGFCLKTMEFYGQSGRRFPQPEISLISEKLGGTACLFLYK